MQARTISTELIMDTSGQLHEGMQLSGEEFHNKYLKADPNLRKVQLINGVVRMPSPVRYDGHDEENTMMNTLLGLYFARVKGGLKIINNATLKLNSRTHVQADFGLRRIDGLSTIEDGYIVGPVELVGEIAASSVERDTTEKFEEYQSNGCKEYIIWKTLEREFVWYKLVSGQYQEIVPVNGILKSEEFPGLHIDKDALLAGDYYRLFDGLNRALDELTVNGNEEMF